MTDWGASGRRDSYEARVVSPLSLRETGEVLNIVDGESKLDWDWEGDNIATGTIVTAGADTSPRMVRIYHTVDLPDGTGTTEVLGTYFCESSSASASFGAVKRTYSCYSALYRHNKDYLVSDFARSAGYNIVKELTELVEADGGHLLADPNLDSGKCHTIDVWWEVGENKGDILRTICDWCSWQLGVDELGNVTVSPYLAPSKIAPSHVFEDGHNCTYLAGYDYSNTYDDAVNRVIAHYSRDSKQDDPEKDNYDPYPLTATAVANLADEHPYSYRNMGFHRSYVLKASDPCWQDELQAQADRHLAEHCGGYYEFQIEHVGIPGLRVGDVVQYVNGTDGSQPIDSRLQVTKISMTLGNGCRCSTTLKELTA